MATSMKAFGKTIFDAKANCAIITAGQVWSVAQVAFFACKAAGTPGCGAPNLAQKVLLAEEYADVGDDVMKYGKIVYNKALPVMKEVAQVFLPTSESLTAAAKQRAAVKAATTLKGIAKELSALQKAMLAKNVVSGTSKATSMLSRFSFTKDYSTKSGQLALLRDAATLASVFIAVGQTTGRLPADDLGLDAAMATFGVIASFAYPTSGT
jgi:hypothetical protein